MVLDTPNLAYINFSVFRTFKGCSSENTHPVPTQVRQMCFPEIDHEHWLSNLEATGWLKHIKMVLAGALQIADKVFFPIFNDTGPSWSLYIVRPLFIVNVKITFLPYQLKEILNIGIDSKKEE